MMDQIVEGGRTPEGWCQLMAEQGIHLSARTLRQKARQYGAFYAMGQAMFLLPSHVEVILKFEAARRAPGYRRNPSATRSAH
ncbi:hypothetical protein GCM10011324_05770 [Allosediminivita pacifica]|nr:hypothetical protein GCM10011324_05770 [Allosediminivita pacifica]